MTRRIVWLAAALFALPSCASSKKKKDELMKITLEEAARSYNEAVRWGQLEKAVSFVAPEDRDRFLTAMQAGDKDIRVTEIRVGSVDILEGTDDATVTVTRSFFHANELTEKSETFIQRWYRKQTRWYVRFQP